MRTCHASARPRPDPADRSLTPLRGPGVSRSRTPVLVPLLGPGAVAGEGAEPALVGVVDAAGGVLVPEGDLAGRGVIDEPALVRARVTRRHGAEAPVAVEHAAPGVDVLEPAGAVVEH